MSRYDFSAQRLFVADELATGREMAATPEAFNYLVNVLRMRLGDAILLFNGRNGEFHAELADVSRRGARLRVGAQTRPQTARNHLDYCFAPLKQARQDYMVQKATEMGAGRLQPVITNRTQARKVNTERLRANAIEAAEQCGVLCVPDICEPVSLEAFLARRPGDGLLIFCDENAPLSDPLAMLAQAKRGAATSVLVGPEGGFDEGERLAICRSPNCMPLSLGPRILRADTAAVAVLALVQAALGDWRD